jgi:hypothetical protein
MMAPKVSGLDIHRIPAAQQVLTFGGVVFNLGNTRQPSLGGCSALTSEGANKLISQPIITVSDICPSTRRIAALVRAIPMLVYAIPTACFLGVIRSTHHTGRIKQELFGQRLQQRLRLLQIARVEPFRRPPLHRGQQVARLWHLALVPPEAREAYCGA